MIDKYVSKLESYNSTLWMPTQSTYCVHINIDCGGTDVNHTGAKIVCTAYFQEKLMNTILCFEFFDVQGVKEEIPFEYKINARADGEDSSTGRR